MPIRIREHEIRNRVVLPPMVRFGWAGEDGRVTDRHIAHYRDCAEGGAGLTIVEAAYVAVNGRTFPSQLGLWEDGQIEGFARIAEAVHGAGSTALLQIQHAGYRGIDGEAVCPSDWRDAAGETSARAMTLGELRGMQDAFIAAAHRAKSAGLDGVELHAAHGYLLNQFASAKVNRREDAYGGSIENRARFTCEIIAGLKAEMPGDFIVGIRVGGNEPTVEEGAALCRLYEKAGADLLHISTGMGPVPVLPDGFDFDYRVWLASGIKPHVGVPVIAVGGLDEDEKADTVIERGYADMAAVARGFLADSHWAVRKQRGEKVKACSRCHRCRWLTQADSCPQ